MEQNQNAPQMCQCHQESTEEETDSIPERKYLYDSADVVVNGEMKCVFCLCE